MIAPAAPVPYSLMPILDLGHRTVVRLPRLGQAFASSDTSSLAAISFSLSAMAFAI